LSLERKDNEDCSRIFLLDIYVILDNAST